MKNPVKNKGLCYKFWVRFITCITIFSLAKGNITWPQTLETKSIISNLHIPNHIGSIKEIRTLTSGETPVWIIQDPHAKLYLYKSCIGLEEILDLDKEGWEYKQLLNDLPEKLAFGENTCIFVNREGTEFNILT